ncbi:MAG TPA: hypothetical protein VMY88_11785 [Acidimicrobiales bacterium]|nr:hypothetical protein [Acidimicrobiales bacterium]
MKNRVLRALLLGTAIGGLVIGALPAQAATVSWTDDKDDAVGAGLPNEPGYDIQTVKLSNDGGNFTWELGVPGLADGTPMLSTGYNFRMNFTHGETAFRFAISENILGEQTFSLAPTTGATPVPPAALECEKCEGKIDREAKKVVFTAPLASLDKAFKSVEAPGVAGQEWTALSVVSNRPFGIPNPGGALPVTGVVQESDEALPPEGTTFTF